MIAYHPEWPPHPIEFHEKDPNKDRSCARCGFPVPAGCKGPHMYWCLAVNGPRVKQVAKVP